MLAVLESEIDVLRRSHEFECYQRAREYVLSVQRRRKGLSAVHQPSAYWKEELANFDYLFDASPLIIRKLRQHSYHVTGLKVYDYRSNKDGAQADLDRKLRALIALDETGLKVPESRICGGFGFEIDGDLYNVDTLKYYEALIALDRGAVLSGLRESTSRPVVVEIGAGWGGFPYQFKTLFPRVTYVVVDLPELFLFSATYLMSAFPEARVILYDPGQHDAESLRDADFVFVPNHDFDTLPIGEPHLVVNMVSFQEMTSEQVESYARRAHELNTAFLYSLNRDRSPYNTQLTNVADALEKYYWLHEICMLPVSYNRVLKEKGPKQKAGPSYRHHVGWRRLPE